MLKATVALMTLALAGCIPYDLYAPVADQTPVTVAAAASPKPLTLDFGFVKRRGTWTVEEFRSTSADCKMRAEIAQSGGTDPNGFYRNCMRENDWVEVPKRLLYRRRPS